MPHTRGRAGFSLIEVMIVILIILTMTGVITANYVQYSEEKKLSDSIVNLRAALTVARSKAIAGDIGTYPCDEFAGYEVTYDEINSVYESKLCCNAACNVAPPPPVQQSYVVASRGQSANMEVRNDFDVTFLPFARGTDLTNPLSIELKNTFINRCNYITVTRIGVIDVGQPYDC
jgi:prepilin-type N-terminal cleavage/methylation domain-containing protein